MPTVRTLCLLCRYGYDWGRIRSELLPTKTPDQLFHRKQNRVAGNAPDNRIKVGVRPSSKGGCAINNTAASLADGGGAGM